MQHPGVKASAAAAAALDQQLGITRAELFQYLVHAEHVPVQHTPLVGRGVGIDVRDRAVEIPFEVCDIGTVEHGADRTEDMLPYLLTREIEHQLAARADRRPPRDREHPVGMSAAERAVLADHLRLHPDAELQPQRVYAACKLAERHAELFLVDGPVTERAPVIPPRAEPAVVHHEHLHAELRGVLRECEQTLAREIEIRGLPAVEQDGRSFLAVFAAADAAAQTAVKSMAQPLKARGAVGQNDLRRADRLAGDEGICRLHLVHADRQARLRKLVALRLGKKAAAPDKLHPPHAPGALCRVAVAEDHKGVVLVRGIAAPAADRVRAASELPAVKLPLEGVAAGEGDEVIVPADRI